MLNGQLELSLKAEQINAARALYHAPRTTAAHWWFHRMRQVAERAIDYPPAQPQRADPLTGLPTWQPSRPP